MSNKIKHLEMIQEIIQRMSRNSFTLKGWAITLVVGIFAMAGSATKQKYLLIAFLPLIAFWFLDTYYFQLERKYKGLFRCVARKKEENIDFSMEYDPTEETSINGKSTNYWKCFWEPFESFFYGPVILAIAVVMYLTKK